MRVQFSPVAAGVLAAVLVTAASQASNVTQTSVEKAQAVIDAAVEAHGGTALTEGLRTLEIAHETVNHAIGQSRRPGAPWDRNENAGTSAVDLENGVFVTRNHGNGGGFEFATATIISGEDSVQVDYRAGTATPIPEPDMATTSGPFVRVTPALLVRQVHSRAHTAHYLGRVDYGGAVHDVVAFSMEVGPAISLYFDAKTHVLNYSERVLPGFGLVQYRFLDYKTVDGVPFNQRFELRLNDELNLERTIVRTVVNETIAPHLTVDASLVRLEPAGPDPLAAREVAEGVWHIGGGGTYAMFVEMDDHVVAVGGTAAVAQAVPELRKAVTGKPIRYGVLTHHHSDHVLGVPTYVAEGATVLAATAHEQVVRDAAGDEGELKLETVDSTRVLSDGQRRVEIVDIGPTAHTEHLLVAWLPDEGILFEADHFAMPRTGPVPPAVSSTHTFARALARHGLKPQRILSSHSPVPGTMGDLEAAVKKKPANKRVAALDRRFF